MNIHFDIKNAFYADNVAIFVYDKISSENACKHPPKKQPQRKCPPPVHLVSATVWIISVICLYGKIY